MGEISNNSMNNKLLFLNKKHTDTSIDQAKTRDQETLEIKLNKQKETIIFITNKLS